MSEQSIYSALRAAGMSAAGACAMIGNAWAESGLRADNAQDGMGVSDAEYVRRFNSTPELCYTDAIGFGLFQWTYHQRKRNLVAFARAWGAGVEDEEMQVQFALEELRSEYSALFRFLCTTADIDAAADRICAEFERPAVNNFMTRREFSRAAYERLIGAGNVSISDTTTPASFPPDLSILMLQAILKFNTYDVEITGYKDSHFLAQLRQFVSDIGG